MKMAARRTTKLETSFEDDYRSALSEYAERSGEAGLGRAYELGRRAMTERRGVVEIVAIHHQALQRILRERRKEKCNGRLLRASADESFLHHLRRQCAQRAPLFAPAREDAEVNALIQPH